MPYKILEFRDEPALHKEYYTVLIPDMRKYFHDRERKYIVDHIIDHLKNVNMKN